MKKTDFLIVEDELLIAETISEILEKAGCTQIRIVDSFDSAITEIENRKPDMVLTDINLEKDKSGIDLGEVLHSKYRIPFIYITSHSSAEILDKAKHTRPNAYIVKPFKSEDLVVAIELALFNSFDKPVEETGHAELMIKDGRAIVRLSCSSIVWLEADGNYTTIYLRENKRRVTRTSLTELTEQLPADQFIRIHKSYLVNKNFIRELRSGSLIMEGHELPIGRTYQQHITDIFKK
jgi:DNA-binding LytR/AlgR family response regulator